MLSKGFVISKHGKIINSYIDSFIGKHSKLSIILVYNIVNLIAVAALYPLIPVFMCYGVNVHEVSKAVGLSYDISFIIGGLIEIIISAFVIYILVKDIDKWIKVLREKEVDFEKVKEIRKESINLPYKIYICQTFLMIFSTVLVCIVSRIILNFPMILLLKVNIIVFSFSFFTAVISYTFSKKIFSRILFDTYFDSCVDGVRVDIKAKMFLQIMPMIIATSLLMALLGYSRVIKEKGDIIYESYKLQFQEKLTNLNEIKDSKMLFNTLASIKLKGIKTSYFVVSPKGDIINPNDSANSLTFIYSINNPEEVNRVYGITKEIQGVVQKECMKKMKIL